MRISILILLFLSFTIIANAQPACSGPGRLPTSAQAVCGYIPFKETNVVNCTGPNLPNPTGCPVVTTDNSRWYKFHCFQAGTFGFLIIPFNAGDDYDWEIMDITGHLPSDVYIMELRISLNLSGQTGNTGCTAAGTSDVNCAGGAPGTQFNRILNLVAGHDYVMMVNNWSSSQSGYNINFSGTASLTNNSLPTITNVGIAGCDDSKLKVTFSEDVLCDSISPLAGTEFSVTNGTNIITGIASDCSLGANGVPYIILNFQAPLPAGNYQLNVTNGSDGNTLANVCGLLMLPVSIPFTVAPTIAAAIDTITFTGCAPTILDVKLTKPVWCSSVSFPGGGSEFTIQPGNIQPASVVAVCSGAVQSGDLLHINLQNPLPHGNYQLVIGNGFDGDTFIDTCGGITATTSIPFVINQTTIAPAIQSLTYDECHRDRLIVNFDKPVACASLSATGSEFFSVQPNLPAITAVTSNCGSNNYTTQVTLFFQQPLSTQNFNVIVNNGTDGNTLSDSCYAFMPQGYNVGFTATQPPQPVFDSVQFDNCNPTFVKAFFSHPIKCNSILANGWPQFAFTGPSYPGFGSIISATPDPSTCSQGYTKWILFQLATPVTIAGNYSLSAGNSPFGQVTDTCDMRQLLFENISFSMLGKPSAAFTSQVKFACKMDTITFSHPGGNGINSWQWTFDDGSTATGQTVTKLFPVSTPTVNIRLIVSNGFCIDTVSNTVTLGNAFHAEFALAPKDTICINTPVSFTNNSAGNNLQYLWLFGDNTQFAGQTPSSHVYTSSNTFNIKLAVTDPYGCTDTAGILLNVAALPTIDFTGLGTQYCSDKTISLTRVISNNISNYTWDNGDGVTFQNRPQVQFSYAKEAVYTITLTGTDKYCGTAQVSKPVAIFAVPKINLGNDTVLCPAVSLPIGVTFNNGYNYLWNNGATTSKIFTDIFTADYSLLVDNNGCKATDAISVKVLPACLIKVPGAFTPNSDGVNDKLKAINADLAKEFTLKVYNRFGELMFSTNDPLDGWNGYYKGVRAEAGTYVWQLSYIDPWSFKKVFESGTSILIR
jgi:gliding motility-associated-like protein